MEELKVRNVMIGKQFEESENLEKFLEIVKSKKILISVVEAGSRINIEKNLYFDVLWPSTLQSISENSINNNALVCKLNYNNFSILFTGDVEEEAERVLTSKYIDRNTLKSTVLKVAHHGSKSSSTEDLLKLIQPKVALIGVGKNNTFGHPNSDVLNRFDKLRFKNL